MEVASTSTHKTVTCQGTSHDTIRCMYTAHLDVRTTAFQCLFKSEARHVLHAFTKGLEDVSPVRCAA
jgi:hypothetical protein